MSGIIVLALTLLFSLIAQPVLTACCARLAGVRVRSLRLFVGPTLLSLPLGRVALELGAVPLGSYVAFEPVSEANDALDALSAASLPARLWVALTPWLVLFLPVVAVLSPLDALLTAASAWPQFLAGGLAFWREGHAPIETLLTALTTTPPVLLSATILAKLVGINLLPSPGSAGGVLLAAVLPESWAMPAQLTIAAVLALTALGWFVAAGLFLLG